MPKYSIIIPVYNVEKYIKKCLDSVFSQTDKDFEVIVVNDGTKDNSMDIVKKYDVGVTVIAGCFPASSSQNMEFL